ncbi:C40 family peptidase [Alicyclobacillus dauci]|uniref:C40 family peptidase n=1 Tax=Alicyclobacillus dauci TaxID=1475485 RepID=A0ABY6ZAB6_9BACL|nr:C40 family peptidase [Alicyclobacillus dauci]WAH39194.1 C40 family peptidase [Alicyclobacillus dauci]
MKNWAVSVGGLLLASAPLTIMTNPVQAATERFVETQHGWVGYHQEPNLKSVETGRLQEGDKAQLINKVNSWWYEISVNGKVAYITTNAKYTNVVSAAATQGGQSATSNPTATNSAGGTELTSGSGTSGSSISSSSSGSYVVTNHGWVSYYSSPGSSSPITGRLQLGDKAQLISQINAYWYEISVNGETEYITTSKQYVHLTTGSGSASTPGVSEPTSPASGNWKVQADAVIQAAETQLNVPYLWGHQEPGIGFDCSNFVEWAYHQGIGVSFSTSSQYQRDHVGTPVALSDIREGDLLFFKTKNNPTGGGHVGIYIGDGQVIQEGGGRAKVTIESLSGTWFGPGLVFARRVIQ